MTTIMSLFTLPRKHIYEAAVRIHGDPGIYVSGNCLCAKSGSDEDLFWETLHDVEDEFTNNAKFKYAGLIARREIRRIKDDK